MTTGYLNQNNNDLNVHNPIEKLERYCIDVQPLNRKQNSRSIKLPASFNANHVKPQIKREKARSTNSFQAVITISLMGIVAGLAGILNLTAISSTLS